MNHKEKVSLITTLIKLVSDDSRVRSEGVMEVETRTDTNLGDKAWDFELIGNELRNILHHEELQPVMTAAEFVERLLALNILAREENLFYCTKKQHKKDIFIDQWIAKYENAPEELAKLIHKTCNRETVREHDFPHPTETFFVHDMLLSELGPELEPASDILRWMLNEENLRNSATNMIFRMGSAGEPFFKDLLKIAENDRDAVSYYAWQIGPLVRTSPEKMEKLLRMAESPDKRESSFGLTALKSVGPLDPVLYPIAEKISRMLFRRSHNAFQLLYGMNPISMELRNRRDEIAMEFNQTTSALAQMDRSETTACYLLELLETQLPEQPLEGPESQNFNDDAWELHCSPRNLVDGLVVTALGWFSAFPEIFVPRLISLLTTFKEFNCDLGKYDRILDTLAVYAHTDPNSTPILKEELTFQIDGLLEVFRNRHDPIYKELPGLLAAILWDDPSNKEESEWDNIVLQMIGCFGSAATAQIPVLEELEEIASRRYGSKYGTHYYENNPEIPNALRKIRKDRSIAPTKH